MRDMKRLTWLLFHWRIQLYLQVISVAALGPVAARSADTALRLVAWHHLLLPLALAIAAGKSRLFENELPLRPAQRALYIAASFCNNILAVFFFCGFSLSSHIAAAVS